MTKSLFSSLCALALGAACLAAPALAETSSCPGCEPGHMQMGHMKQGHMQMGHMQMGHAGHGDMMEPMFKALALTDAQKAQLRTLRQQSEQANKPLRESLKTKQRALWTTLRSGTATEAQALAQQQAINDLQSQLEQARIKAWFRGRAVLTPAQLQKLQSLKMGPMKR